MEKTPNMSRFQGKLIRNMPLITSSYPMTPVPGTCRDQQDERCWARGMFFETKGDVGVFGSFTRESTYVLPFLVGGYSKQWKI